ncbi:MAG: sel1 repeat family protein [Lachnospiraceae bacterium]|nr:sel1 repeat family protein [Lachnospiraceae bacterium]
MEASLRMHIDDLRLSEQELDSLENKVLMGDMEAQYKLGEYWLLTHNSEAENMLFQASSKGHILAKAALGHMYLYGEGTEMDVEAAERLLVEAATYDVINAQDDLVVLYEKKNDFFEAFRWMNRSANNGSKECMYRLARALHMGYENVSINIPKAFEMYSKAAQMGSPKSMYALVRIYATGDNCQKDLNKATNILAKAIQTEYIYEEVYECFLLLNKPDYAYKHSVMYAKKYPNEYIALFNTAKCYYYGNGVAVDKVQATQYFKKVMELIEESREGREIFHIGLMYENGWGVEKDVYAAEKYILHAIRKGYIPAQEYFKNNSLVGKYSNLLRNMTFKSETKVKYKLYNINFKIDLNMEYYMFAQKFSMIFASYAENYIRLDYQQRINGVNDYFERAPLIIHKLVRNAVDYSIRLMSANTGIDVDRDEFYNKYVRDSFDQKLSEIYKNSLLEMLSLCCSKEEYEVYENLIKFQNILFRDDDVAETANFIMQKKTNLTKVCVTRIAQLLGGLSEDKMTAVMDAISAKVNDIKLKAITTKVKNAFYECILDFDEVLGDGIVEELKLCSIMDPLFDCDLDGGGYFFQCKSSSGVKAKKYLIFALLKEPYNSDYYRYALENFGDDNNTLTEFANKVGVDIDTIKDDMVEEYDAPYVEDPNEQAMIRNMYEAFLTKINYPHKEVSLDVYDELVYGRVMQDKIAKEQRKRKSAMICSAVWEIVFEQNKRDVYDALDASSKKYVEQVAELITTGYGVASKVPINEVLEKDMDGVPLAVQEDVAQGLVQADKIHYAIDMMLKNLGQGVLYNSAVPVLNILYDRYLSICKYNVYDKLIYDQKVRGIIGKLGVLNSIADPVVKKHIIGVDRNFIYTYNNLVKDMPVTPLEVDEVPYVILNEVKLITREVVNGRRKATETVEKKSNITVVITNKAAYIYNTKDMTCKKIETATQEKFSLSLVKDSIVIKYRYTKEKIEVATDDTFVGENMMHCIKQAIGITTGKM